MEPNHYDDNSEDSNSPESTAAKIRISNKMGVLFESERSSDFTIRAYSGSVLKEKKVHKNILSLEDNYFKRLVSGNFTENENGTVEIKDIEFEVLYEVLRYIYTAKVKNLNDMALKLMIAADRVSMT